MTKLEELIDLLRENISCNYHHDVEMIPTAKVILDWHNSKQSELHEIDNALRKKIREQRDHIWKLRAKLNSKQLTEGEIKESLLLGWSCQIGKLLKGKVTIQSIAHSIKEAMDRKSCSCKGTGKIIINGIAEDCRCTKK